MEEVPVYILKDKTMSFVYGWGGSRNKRKRGFSHDFWAFDLSKWSKDKVSLNWCEKSREGAAAGLCVCEFYF